MRQANISRSTAETTISVVLKLDGEGKIEARTGVGFLDHMLTHVARHGLFDLTVAAKGDLETDAHHTVEDVGICLGKAFHEAVGAPVGLTRFGHAVVPMDDALAEAAIDFCGRPFLVFDAAFATSQVGEFDVELTEEFFRAFATHSKTTLHLLLRHGRNAHHCIEALFKAFARALREAVCLDPRVKDIPSTKGILEA
ncbi:MAG TPA: imidazoleglycerol-phosphate dehydratase HisB [Candidatus Hydrogenedentes bacterium]|nr:imidazoleglycerol-phosphate dehydratase HisB [Candidatus Hydrogenedentota bacterium]